LQLIYEAKGLSPEEAAELSAKLLADPKAAIDVLAREELGIDPSELGGSPWVAAGTSMLLFALGALVPVLPLMFLKGTAAIVASMPRAAPGFASWAPPSRCSPAARRSTRRAGNFCSVCSPRAPPSASAD
jgi:hypothetical protein